MKTKLILDAITAVGTFALAAVAIWGDLIRAVLQRPALSLHLRSTDPYLVEVAQGVWAAYVHVVVVNKRRRRAVHDCHALLTAYSKKRPRTVHATPSD